MIKSDHIRSVTRKNRPSVVSISRWPTSCAWHTNHPVGQGVYCRLSLCDAQVKGSGNKLEVTVDKENGLQNTHSHNTQIEVGVYKTIS